MNDVAHRKLMGTLCCIGCYTIVNRHKKIIGLLETKNKYQILGTGNGRSNKQNIADDIS